MSASLPWEGRHVVVTGANSGLGLASTIALARSGAHVIMVCRNPTKAEAAREEVIRAIPHASVVLCQGDLGSLEAVRDLGRRLLLTHPVIDVLINNAGVALVERSETIDGLETTFAVNHLAPFLLTHLLLPSLLNAPAGRIVNVASHAHRWGTIDFADLQSRKNYGIRPAYGASKLANILFTRSLARRLEGTPVTVNAAHPGAVRTGIGHSRNPVIRALGAFVKLFLRTPERGARTQVMLAMSEDVATLNGRYFANEREAEPRPKAKDDDVAERLWDLSAELVGIDGSAYGEA